ncbi:MAG: hypothetical protein RIA71_11135 [Oceanicaulis sp.]
MITSTTLIALAAFSQQAAAVTVYENGHVWTREAFERRDLAVAGDRFIDPASAPADAARVDLSGGFVTPGFTNAHQHTPRTTMANSWGFMEAGVYYVWNPNVLGSLMTQERETFFARPDTIELRESAGGVTAPGSHPEPLYVNTLGPYVYDGAGYDEMYLDAFHYVRDLDEIETTLDRLEAHGADFVKAYLMASQRFEPPGPDGDYRSTSGLDPALVPPLVEAAHARGLPIGFHIETAEDLRIIAAAGADYAMHLPGYSAVARLEGDFRALTEADAILAADAGLAVIPTTLVGANRIREAQNDPEREVDPAAVAAAYGLQAANMAVLHAAGVTILPGTDGNPGSVPGEVTHWVEIGALSDAEAATVLLNATNILFGDIGAGCFDPGCRADFLVLGGDPTADISAIETIVMRIKSGADLAALHEAGAGAAP